MKDAIRNVFDDPDIGDALNVDGELYTVERIERHGGKTHVVANINNVPGRRRWIDLASWREYKHDPDATVATNRSIADAFE